jgi:hypothetical protein
MKAQYDFRKGKRGAVVRVPSGKTRITIRLDNEILDVSHWKKLCGVSCAKNCS